MQSLLAALSLSTLVSPELAEKLAEKLAVPR
jgi:hypothetical protein